MLHYRVIWLAKHYYTTAKRFAKQCLWMFLKFAQIVFGLYLFIQDKMFKKCSNNFCFAYILVWVQYVPVQSWFQLLS